MSNKKDTARSVAELQGKRAASVWGLLIATGEAAPENHHEILEGLARWETSEEWASGIVPEPHIWLAERRWTQHPEPAEPGKAEHYAALRKVLYADEDNRAGVLALNIRRLCALSKEVH